MLAVLSTPVGLVLILGAFSQANAGEVIVVIGVEQAPQQAASSRPSSTALKLASDLQLSSLNLRGDLRENFFFS